MKKEASASAASAASIPPPPFLTATRLKEAMELLDTAESVMPVVAFSYPPQRGLVVGKRPRPAQIPPVPEYPLPGSGKNVS